MEMLKYEKKYWSKGIKHVGGIDEAGRGPLAGPVVASCVILSPEFNVEGINDSKKLTPKKRNRLAKLIKDNAIDVSIGIAHEDEIDELNILQATFLAMKRAVGNLRISPNQLLIDGPYSDIKLIPIDNIIKGDSKSISIAAASIIAKVERDKMMCEYNKIYSQYKFDKHKGYGTKAHINSLEKFKATPIHRKSFKIVKSHLPTFSYYQENNLFSQLALELVATNFIKRNYTLEYKSIELADNNFIDFIYTNDENEIYIKVDIRIFNQASNNIDINKYLDVISKKIIEKESKKKKWFNVISVSFKAKNKPKIIITYNEQIS